MSSSPPETAPALPIADRKARWRTCIHEGAHMVAGGRLLGQTTRAAVFNDASGVADVGDGENDVPTSFKDALVTAAGSAAEFLADLYPPPQVALPVPLEVAYPESAGRLLTSVATMMTDDVAVARWCIRGRETQPDLWAGRHEWVRSGATEFVIENRHQVIEVATSLYGRGIVSLPAEPAKEGETDAD